MKLVNLVNSIGNPHDYFQGHKASISGMPDNVLLFKRNKPLKQGVMSYHHRHVLICNLAGRGAVLIDGQVHILKPQQGILVFPFQGHEYGRFSPGVLSWLFVTFDFEKNGCLQTLRNNPFELPQSRLRLFEALLNSFLAAQTGDDDESGVLGVRVAEILVRLVRDAEKFTPGAAVEPDSPRLSLIRRTVAYIHENLEHRIGIADVAKQVCLSPSRLRAVFKAEVGVGLGEFIARCQINRACALLGQSEMNISEVAHAGGYESIYSFSRTFKRRQGLSPSQYRAGLRQAKSNASRMAENQPKC